MLRRLRAMCFVMIILYYTILYLCGENYVWYYKTHCRSAGWTNADDVCAFEPEEKRAQASLYCNMIHWAGFGTLQSLPVGVLITWSQSSRKCFWVCKQIFESLIVRRGWLWLLLLLLLSSSLSFFLLLSVSFSYCCTLVIALVAFCLLILLKRLIHAKTTHFITVKSPSLSDPYDSIDHYQVVWVDYFRTSGGIPAIPNQPKSKGHVWMMWWCVKIRSKILLCVFNIFSPLNSNFLMYPHFQTHPKTYQIGEFYPATSPLYPH